MRETKSPPYVKRFNTFVESLPYRRKLFDPGAPLRPDWLIVIVFCVRLVLVRLCRTIGTES